LHEKSAFRGFRDPERLSGIKTVSLTPFRDMTVYLFCVCVCVFSSVRKGLATGRWFVQGFLPRYKEQTLSTARVIPVLHRWQRNELVECD